MNSAVDVVESLCRLHLWGLGGTSMPSFSERRDGRPRSAGGPPLLVRSSHLPAACCLLPAAGKCIGVVAILCDSFALYARISFPGLASFELPPPPPPCSIFASDSPSRWRRDDLQLLLPPR